MKETSVIQVENLWFDYGGESILQDISFSVPEESICAIVGPNGSGKTTLLRVLLGFLNPQKGKVKILNKKPNEVLDFVAYVPQRFDFDRTFPMTVFELLKFSYPEYKKEKIVEYLRHLDMEMTLNMKLGSLSQGQIQRVMIVRAILRDPKILFLDEPVSGIDTTGENTFYDLIVHLHKEHNSTIVMVSHELDVVAGFANFVLCLNRKLVCSGRPEKVLTSETLKELYGKEATIYRHR